MTRPRFRVGAARAAALGGLVLLALGDAALAAAPRVAVDEPVFDFGEAAAGASLSHVFTVRNDGDGELRITNVVSGCACATAVAEPVIAAGGTGTVRAVLDTTGIEGAVAKQIVLETNDPEVPRALLTLRVAIAGPVAVQPPALRWAAAAVPAVAGVTLAALDRDDLVVARLECALGAVRVSFRPAQASEALPQGRGRQWRIEAALDPKAPPGPISGVVRVVTNHPGAPIVVVPVTGFVRGAGD